jgi:hypothetical protein
MASAMIEIRTERALSGGAAIDGRELRETARTA